MPVVSLDLPVAGDALDFATENARFAAFNTTIDEYNVGDWAIDQRQLDTDGLVHVVWADDQVNLPAVGTAYLDIDAMDPGAVVRFDARQELAHGSGMRIIPAAPVTIKAGDLVRVWFEVEVTDQTLAGAYGPYSGAEYAWLFQPYWDLTDATLTNYEPLPGDQPHGDDIISAGTTPGYGVDTGRSVALCPTEFQVDVPTASQDVEPEPFTAHGSYAYVHAGADITVYGLAVFASGLYGIRANPTTPDPALRPLQAVGAPTVTVREGRISILVLRK